MSDNQKICYCFNVSINDIINAIDNGAKTFDEVQKITKVSCACGKCRARAEKVTLEILENKR